MNERALELKVGILVTVCIGILVGFVLLLGDFSTGDTRTFFLDADTSAALKSGAPVKVAGVPAGRVVDVAYLGGKVDPKTGRAVLVRATLRVREEIALTLRHNARFYITTQGVLGEKYVEIEPAAPGTEERGDTHPIAQQDVVYAEPPLRLEIMAMNANRVLNSLSRVLRDNEENLNAIIVNTHETMKSVKRVVARVDTLLADNGPKVDDVVDKLLAIEDEALALGRSANTILGDGTELKRAVAQATRLVDRVSDAVPTVVNDLRDTLAKYGKLAETSEATVLDAKVMAAASIAQVDGILADVKAITANIREGQGTVGALLMDEEMYDDVREMMKDLKRHPWKFIWKE